MMAVGAFLVDRPSSEPARAPILSPSVRDVQEPFMRNRLIQLHPRGTYVGNLDARTFYTLYSVPLDYSANAGCIASWKATALAAIICISGPPCVLGKTAISMAEAISSALASIVRYPAAPDLMA